MEYKYRNDLWPMQYVSISYRRRESVSKTRIAWARDRFYIFL